MHKILVVMKPTINNKKKLIVSYKNLSDELKELFKEAYPDGYTDHLQRTVKPNGDSIFSVPLETEDTTYMVKFEVKIDSGLVDEDLDKDLYGDDEEKEMKFDTLESVDKDSDVKDHTERQLHHGDYEDVLNNRKPLDKNSELSKELAEAFGDDEEEFDPYIDDYDPEEEEDEEEMEPSADDLRDIEDNFFVPLDDTDIPESEKVVLPKRGEKKSGAGKRTSCRTAKAVEAPAPEPKKRGRKKKSEI